MGKQSKDPLYQGHQWVQYWIPIDEVDRVLRALNVIFVPATTTCEANKLTEDEMKKKIKSWGKKKRK